MKPPASSGTFPDEIPAVHVLEAAQSQDRKETEDLLAGFDRPGRGPKRPSAERDFVDYYAKKKNPGIESGAGRAGRPMSSRPPSARAVGPAPLPQVNVSTVIVPRKGAGTSIWFVWAAVGAVMLVVGGGVAYFATSDGAPSKSVTSSELAPTGPSAATTITAATAPSGTTSSRTANEVPPPATVTDPPATATATATATTAATTAAAQPSTRGSARRDPRAVGSPSATSVTSASEGTKPPPRDDFIRDL